MNKQDLKVGDRVRIVRCVEWEKSRHDGPVGTLKIIATSGLYPFLVRWDDGGFCQACEVEKLPTRGRPRGSKNRPKVKEIEVPKCPKTVTGKHIWPWLKSQCRINKAYPDCRACGLVDDREESK